MHLPVGSTPKDGPSAGVALVSALFSLITGERARRYLAMTGEITLRGKILPVGGIKEKVLAGHRARIKTIILPSRNEKDLSEIPLNVRREIDFRFVETIEDVLQTAFTSVHLNQMFCQNGGDMGQEEKMITSSKL